MPVRSPLGKISVGRRWFVIELAAKQPAGDAVKWLEARGFEPYFPVMRVRRPTPRHSLSHKQRRSGTVIMRNRLDPVFGSSVFIRFDVDVAGWQQSFVAPGFRGMPFHGDWPLLVHDGLIRNLKKAEVDGAIPGELPASVVFRVRDAFGIDDLGALDGPIAAFKDEIERIRQCPLEALDPWTRYRIMIEIFGRLAPVELLPDLMD